MRPLLGHLPHAAAHHAHVTSGEGAAIVVLIIVCALLGARRARHVPATATGDGSLLGLAALIVAAIAAWNLHPAVHAAAPARATPSLRPSPVIIHTTAHASAPWLPGWGIIAVLIIAILAGAAVIVSVTAINATLRKGD